MDNEDQKPEPGTIRFVRSHAGSAPLKKRASWRETVILADDDHLMRAMLSHILKGAGFSVKAAADGSEVLSLVYETTGVVLLDLNMPVMDGMTCLRHMQARHGDVCPIMITSSDAITDAVTAMKNGAVDYLTKPIDRRELLVVVEKAMENWRRTRRMKEMACELNQIASRIQQTLLLGDPPNDLKGLTIASLSIPSQSIDGDFYDFIQLSETSLDIVVGDVMGKGVAPALLGAAIKSHFLRAINALLGSGARNGLPDPAAIVNRLSDEVNARIEDIESFVTLCYARLDMARGRLTFVDCGHMETLQFHHATRTVTALRGDDMPLGFPQINGFHQHQVGLAPGDLLLFYSDGITDARCPDGRFFSQDGLVRFLESHGHLQPDAFLSDLRQTLIRHTGSETFADDLTCVVVGVNPPS